VSLILLTFYAVYVPDAVNVSILYDPLNVVTVVTVGEPVVVPV
jgi:hypothetical protein